MAHAVLSPSSAERWMTCPGSVALCKDLPDSSSKYADEGTAAHELAEAILNGADGASLVGKKAENGVTFTSEMLTEVLKYTNYVNDLVAVTGGLLLTEQRLPISSITGEADAHGTSDTVILAPDELIIADLKFGMGVEVDAQDNKQLQIYAAAALDQFSLSADFQRVRMVIHQPRLNHVSEWAISIEQLNAFTAEAWSAAIETRKPDAPLVPSVKGCKFCRAKATCKALEKEVLGLFETVDPVSADGDSLSTAVASAPLVESWLKAVRAEVERRLLAGTPVPGYKLVQGKRGHRKWSNEAEAETVLKTMRVPHDRMYDYSLVSPTTVEKLFKEGVVGPRQWPKLQPLITQSEGGPSVAPESDKRPAIEVTSASASDFDDVTDLS